jgi:beta-lactamase regulating signal transducer with metallopeptidase domain
MIAWWMAQVALLGVLLALAAFGAESALKVARRPTRWVWAAALGLTAVLGAIAPMQRAASTTIARDWSSIGATPTTTGAAATGGVFDVFIAAFSATWRDVTTQLATQVQRAWRAWNAVMPDRIDRWMLIAWAVASVVLLIAFVAVHVRYQRRRAHWPLGDVLGTRVRIASDTGPAVIGVTRAEIVVPQWLLSRDEQEQRLVIEHELEHVRQHDPLLLAAAQAVVILLPWHPAAWWMASRLRLAIELDCDRRVLQRGASARDYGALLIDLTDHRSGFGAALPAFSCSPSHLERRLIAMTPTKLRYPLTRAICTATIASLALLAACEAKLPTAEEMDRMTASSATAAAGRVALIDTANVAYFINSVPASKADAEKIEAERIASVNVMQRGDQRGGEVRIVTRETAVGDSTSPTRMTYVRTAPARVTLRTPGDSVTLVADTIVLTTQKPFAEGDLRTGLRVLDGSRTSPVQQTSPSRTGFAGLMIVDGVITDAAIVNSISRDQIVSVDVIKGAAATAQYTDPRAANGVVRITTKKAKP